MPITVRCGCAKSFEVDDGQVGRDVICDACRRNLSIPCPPLDGQKLVEVIFHPDEGTPAELHHVRDGLVSCGACRKRVAVKAETCPHCGGDLPQKRFNAGAPFVACPQCPANNDFYEGSSLSNQCRACGASLEVPYREKERVIRIRNEAWGLGLLGAAFGGFVGYFMGEGMGGAVTGAFLAGLVGGWIGMIRWWVLTQV